MEASTNAPARIPGRLGTAATLLAGALHLVLAPEHAEHALAHGLMIGAIGLAQAVVAAFYFLRPSYWRAHLVVLVNSASLVLWILTRVFRAPFSEHAEAIGLTGIELLGPVAKALEVAAMVLLVRRARADVPQRREPFAAQAPLAVVAVGVLAAYCAYGAGLAAEPFFPSLAENNENHEHDDHDHGRGAPLEAPTTTDPHAGHTMTHG